MPPAAAFKFEGAAQIAWDQRVERAAALKTEAVTPLVRIDHVKLAKPASVQVTRAGPWGQGEWVCRDGRPPFVTKFSDEEWTMFFALRTKVNNARAQNDYLQMRSDIRVLYNSLKEEYNAWKLYRYGESNDKVRK